MKYKLVVLLLSSIFILHSCSSDEEVPVQGADGTSYFKKGDKIYYHYINNLMPFLPIQYKTKMKINADTETFVALNNSFAKDKYHVFFKKCRMEVTDPESFRIDSNDIYRDNINIYLFRDLGWEGRLIPVEGADIESYRKINGVMNWAQDDQHVYFGGKLIKDIDSKSFVAISDYITKDKKNIFIGDIILRKVIISNGPDVESFSYNSQTKEYFDKNGEWKFFKGEWVKKEIK